jgi:hypothetical protein
MPVDAPLTLSLRRFSALLAALHDGPLNRHALLDRLGDTYPRTASARPMVDRDVKRLAELGIVIEISRTRPPIYTLRGGVPSFDTAEVRALAIIRDTFGDRHPQAADMRTLLDRLTSQLGEADQHTYQRRQALRAPDRLLRSSLCALLVLLALAFTLLPGASPPRPSRPDFAAIDRYGQQERQAAHLPGLDIVLGGQIVHLKGFSVADSSGRAVTPQTRFHIASLGKSFTALAVMQLVEERKVDLDTPVQCYLLWFRVADAEASSRIRATQTLARYDAGAILEPSSSPGSCPMASDPSGGRRRDRLHMFPAPGNCYHECRPRSIGWLVPCISSTITSRTAGIVCAMIHTNSLIAHERMLCALALR